jgi:hypothetical protein
MAEVKEIVISRSVRINTGNYEGLEHFISMKAELGEFDDVAEEALKLSAKIERALVTQLARSYKVRKKSMTVSEIARHHGLSYVPKEK